MCLTLRNAEKTVSNVSVLLSCIHAQSCPTLCDPMDCVPPGSSVYGTHQSRALEWVPCPPPGDLPGPGIESASPGSPALAGRLFTTAPPRKPLVVLKMLDKGDDGQQDVEARMQSRSRVASACRGLKRVSVPGQRLRPGRGRERTAS